MKFSELAVGEAFTCKCYTGVFEKISDDTPYNARAVDSRLGFPFSDDLEVVRMEDLYSKHSDAELGFQPE